MIVAFGVRASPATAQQSIPATVTSVVDGDTVDARLADGNVVRVGLIGIDTPERGECGFEEAKRRMQRTALNHNVTLVSDPTQAALDSSGAPCSTWTGTMAWMSAST